MVCLFTTPGARCVFKTLDSCPHLGGLTLTEERQNRAWLLQSLHIVWALGKYLWKQKKRTRNHILVSESKRNKPVPEYSGKWKKKSANVNSGWALHESLRCERRAKRHTQVIMEDGSIVKVNLRAAERRCLRACVRACVWIIKTSHAQECVNNMWCYMLI